ncbi:hypothetical protein [Methylomonas sp. 11b]|uniref:hypothetical protein n=1 Tax=Methylomonas sp. 11b TaxID=1168169 RepID=UPI00047E1FD6|nr:hypothetical protein [Methylomonas sp. 11b]
MSNACVIPCPYCAKDIDIIQGMEVLAGQQWTALLKPLPNSVIGALLRYLELFKPLKQELRWSRRLVLTQEIVPMMTAAQVKRNGIVYAAPLPVWEAEMMKLVVNRPESLVLPLKSNGYLLSMIAGRGERAAAKLEQDKIEQQRNRSNVGGAPISVAALAEQAQKKTKSKPPAGWKGAVPVQDSS